MIVQKINLLIKQKLNMGTNKTLTWVIATVVIVAVVIGVVFFVRGGNIIGGKASLSLSGLRAPLSKIRDVRADPYAPGVRLPPSAAKKQGIR